MQPIDRKEPKISKMSPLESINRRKQDAPNIAPLGEVSAEKLNVYLGKRHQKNCEARSCTESCWIQNPTLMVDTNST